MDDRRQKNQRQLASGKRVGVNPEDHPGRDRIVHGEARDRKSGHYRTLMEEVCAQDNCKQALKRVKANKGSPGADGMTVQELPGFLQQHGQRSGNNC